MLNLTLLTLMKFNSLKLLRLRFSTYQASGCRLVYLNMKRILLRFKYSTQFKCKEENNGDGLLRLPECKEHSLFGANMLSVTCNMLSFVRDSVGRAYAALKLSIIKTGVVSKGSTA